MQRYFLLMFLFISALQAEALPQPNILWISAEDMSPVLGCYGDPDAITPNIDQLSEKSILFTHAFATAPVCSPSRSCLIQGVSAPSQGTHQMRSAFPIPETWLGFPNYLRKAGYYTSNNVKTDYNNGRYREIIQASWDENSASAHWRKAPQGKPFFSVFNLMTSHQSRSMVWPYEKFKKEVQSKLSPKEIHKPKKIKLPSYYPDTPTIRKEHARFYDCVTAMDKEVGEILKQLKEDGLEDSTIIFFFSDHGSGMPRHKRSLFDSGLKVPLLVHIPNKYREALKLKSPQSSSKLVSFIDYAPTVLELAGLEPPSHMQGKNFLSHNFKTKYVFGHRDRVDEVIDLARSVRNHRYLYIRNYMPHLGHFQASAWPDLGEIRHDLKKVSQHWQDLPLAQKQFLAPSRPIEELYDCEADPENIQNLIGSSEHQHILSELKQALKEHLIQTRDLGFLSEPYQWELSSQGRAQLSLDDHRAILEAADSVEKNSESEIITGLNAKHPAVRNWNAIASLALSKISTSLENALLKACEDSDTSTQINAAYALVYHKKHIKGLQTLEHHLASSNYPTALLSARIVETLGKKAISLKPAMQALDQRSLKLTSNGPATKVNSGDQDTAMFIRFSTQAFLSDLN